MSAFKDHTITIEYTVTREYYYSESADIVAKTLGISLAKLRRIVNGDDDLSPGEIKLAALIAASEEMSEDFEQLNLDDYDES